MGRSTLKDVLDGSGNPRGGLGRVRGPLRMYWSGRRTFREVRNKL